MTGITVLVDRAIKSNFFKVHFAVMSFDSLFKVMNVDKLIETGCGDVLRVIRSCSLESGCPATCRRRGFVVTEFFTIVPKLFSRALHSPESCEMST